MRSLKCAKKLVGLGNQGKTLRFGQKREIGIKALDFYFPNNYISQEDLEVYDSVPSGKYQIGLGQKEMAFVHSDREDTASISMTAVTQLMNKYNIDENAIGALFVGTETPLDKSKSVKSYLMSLFTNKEMEGIDQTNACYSATAALFNALYWYAATQSHLPVNERKMAIVVGSDIAGYQNKNERPTAGCGSVAMLIGDDATFDIDFLKKATYIDHAYDFYKPNPVSSYPVVDGHFSNECYLKALDKTYSQYAKIQQTSLQDIDYTIFHAPYNKLVQKSFGRLLFNDLKNGNVPENLISEMDELKPFLEVSEAESYSNGQLLKKFTTLSKDLYVQKCSPATELPQRIGNSYSASIYSGLTSLVANEGENLSGKNVMMFSYGSGLAASCFRINVANENDKLREMQEKINMHQRLDQRKKYEISEFVNVLSGNEERYLKNDWKSETSIENMVDGAYYIESIDDRWRRTYGRK